MMGILENSVVDKIEYGRQANEYTRDDNLHTAIHNSTSNLIVYKYKVAGLIIA